MLIKYAFFSGKVKDGKDAEMRAFVATHLTPLWRQFACAEQVRVLHEVKQDPEGPTIPLVLAVTYKDEAAIAAAMDSPARYASRDILPQLYEQYFDEVTLWHYIFNSEEFID